MEVCFVAAEEAVNKQAVCALTALAAPLWTPSVIGTAAAMVAETARHLSAQQIIAQVCCLEMCMQSLVLLLQMVVVCYVCVLHFRRCESSTVQLSLVMVSNFPLC